MDDILSAALGQSGISFLDETPRQDGNQSLGNADVTTSYAPIQQFDTLEAALNGLPEAPQAETVDDNFDDLLELLKTDTEQTSYTSYTDQTATSSHQINQNSKKTLHTDISKLLNVSTTAKANNQLFSVIPNLSTTNIKPSNTTQTVRKDSLLTPDYSNLLELLSDKSIRSVGSVTSQQSTLSNRQSFNFVSSLATKKNLNLNVPGGVVRNSQVDDEENEEDEDEENVEIGLAGTYADYMPLKSRVGNKHPDPVVETSSMASVEPPDIWYKLQLPENVIRSTSLSALQLEAVVYACQQHEKLLPSGRRAGFLIGDGAGVGKGRTIAGIIYENYILGRKRAIWLSVSNDLKYDAMRDLKDVGCHVSVHALNKFKYDHKISSKNNGKVKKGVIFATYSSLIGETQGKAKFRTRLDQLLHWCGPDFDGAIILDECHKAKNLVPAGSSKPTKTGLTVMKLQNSLPKARIVYCSATGASEPKNMAYMNRLGIWGPGTAFPHFGDFIQCVEKRGVGAMELVAMDMKLRGMYIARQLSFAGVTFDIREVSLCSSFVDMYNASVKLWVTAREYFETAAELTKMDSKGIKTMWGQFWSSHQRFFKYLCIAAKVQKVVEIAKEAIDSEKCLVIGLQSTGEARTMDQLDELGGELNDFISTTKGVFAVLVDKHFPTSYNFKSASFYEADANNGKRKRDWRANLKGEKRGKMDFWDSYSPFNSGSPNNSAGGDSDNSDSSAEETINDNSINSDIESDINDDDDDDDGSDSVHSSSDQDSPDEDSWLKSLTDSSSSTKKRKKNKIKSKEVKKTKTSQSNDVTLNAFAAAGLSTGKQFSWMTSTPVTSKDTLDFTSKLSGSNFKGNRVKKATPSTLCEQVSSCPSSKPNGQEPITRCLQMKEELKDKLETISQYLPPNTLDELIDELGGANCVAEMTGRKGRVIANEDGSFAYEPRNKDDVPLEVLNVAEKKRFMDGEKLIAVISEAASSGISLQADRRAKNQRRRIHVTLELPWSADKAIQQFGRSHRSNQVSAPEYVFLISELAGEQRFASIVAKRLESLGALTHGDRRATETRDLSRYNFDTKFGKAALECVLQSVMGLGKAMVPPKRQNPASFYQDVQDGLLGVGLITKNKVTKKCTIPDKDYSNIPRFLNRILGLPVELQNELFTYFLETLYEVIKQAKRNGRWDEGILDLGSQGESVTKVSHEQFQSSSLCGQATTDLLTVKVERGLQWEKVVEMDSVSDDRHEGLYLSKQIRGDRRTAVLVKRAASSGKKGMYIMFRPNVGLQSKHEPIDIIVKRFTKAARENVKEIWERQYHLSAEQCSHAYWRGHCKKQSMGLSCEFGLRSKTCHVLCGSVLSVWTKVEELLARFPGSSKMQIIRLKLDNGNKVVGMLVPNNGVPALKEMLSTLESSL